LIAAARGRERPINADEFSKIYLRVIIRVACAKKGSYREHGTGKGVQLKKEGVLWQ